MNICDCTGRCKCGALDGNGVLRDGHGLRLNVMLLDGADRRQLETGKTLSMMTDTEIRTMRDSVKTMTASEAAKLPIYDNVRGAVMGGGPAEIHFAIVDGARPDTVNDAHIDRMAHQVLYEHRVSNAWRGKDTATPDRVQHQDNGQQLYEQRLREAWKGA